MLLCRGQIGTHEKTEGNHMNSLPSSSLPCQTPSAIHFNVSPSSCLLTSPTHWWTRGEKRKWGRQIKAGMDEERSGGCKKRSQIEDGFSFLVYSWVLLPFPLAYFLMPCCLKSGRVFTAMFTHFQMSQSVCPSVCLLACLSIDRYSYMCLYVCVCFIHTHIWIRTYIYIYIHI